MPVTKASAVKKYREEICPEEQSEKIRLEAYFNWLRTTGGVPVSDEESLSFWIEAEKKVSEEE